MCFFHLQKNVKEHLKNIDKKLKTDVIADVSYMHYCKNEMEFVIAKKNSING